MLKSFLYVFLGVLLFASCKKENDVFEKSPDERLNEKLAEYQGILVGAQNGWKATLTVDSGRGATYSFYFKFNNANRVVMVSDFDSAAAATPKESSYRLKALQQPSLLFDTYSYLHVLSDPDASQNGGSFGLGLASDFEFMFLSASADTVQLLGRQHGSKATLVRATKAEGDAYSGGQFTLLSGYLNRILTYFKRLTVNNQLYDVKVDQLTRTITFSWLNTSGNLVTFSTTYYNTLGGVTFSRLFVNGSTSIPGFNNLVWDAATSTLTATAGAAQATFRPTVFPLKLDVNAPARWWQKGVDEDNYWISFTGFHVNGVDDAFNIRSLARYYYLIYYPGYETGNDLFAPVFINTAGNALELLYGAAPAKPTFTNGIARFRLLGNYGTYPASGPAFLSRSQLLLNEGYYFVQIDENSYDMVSARDGQAWISWVF